MTARIHGDPGNSHLHQKAVNFEPMNTILSYPLISQQFTVLSAVTDASKISL
jgi:hypothetical protein